MGAASCSKSLKVQSFVNWSYWFSTAYVVLNLPQAHRQHCLADIKCDVGVQHCRKKILAPEECQNGQENGAWCDEALTYQPKFQRHVSLPLPGHAARYFDRFCHQYDDGSMPGLDTGLRQMELPWNVYHHSERNQIKSCGYLSRYWYYGTVGTYGTVTLQRLCYDPVVTFI